MLLTTLVTVAQTSTGPSITTSQRTAWLFGAIRPLISIPLPVLYAESVKTTTEAEAGSEGATPSYLSVTPNSLSLSLSLMGAAMRC